VAKTRVAKQLSNVPLWVSIFCCLDYFFCWVVNDFIQRCGKYTLFFILYIYKKLLAFPTPKLVDGKNLSCGCLLTWFESLYGFKSLA